MFDRRIDMDKSGIGHLIGGEIKKKIKNKKKIWSDLIRS